MKLGSFLLCVGLLAGFSESLRAETSIAGAKKVFIIPIREEIASPLVYLVRRGVKEAMEARADIIILDVDSHGGSVKSMIDIIETLERFTGTTVTYVNKNAFSAAALMSFATSQVFMAPQGVIGAAAPVMAAPGGGVQAMPDTMEIKCASAIAALVRAQAEKHGHNKALVDAMMKKTSEFIIDGRTINRAGDLLTLTDVEAVETYGNPPKPLLSSGTVETLDKLLTQLGYEHSQRVFIEPTGVERVGTWINMISPLLLIIGVIGLYIEFKTPGFGLPGIVGISAFLIYFFGGYIAGLSGAEWILLFALGLVLIAVELFVFPGHTVPGILGALCVLVAIVMAMVDVYPSTPDLPVPALRFRIPIVEIVTNLSIALAGSLAAAWLLSRILPRTSLYGTLVSHSTSGDVVIQEQEREQKSRLGEIGVAASVLRPGGKARFGEDVIDVISQGEMIPKGNRVKVIGHSGKEAVVEAVG